MDGTILIVDDVATNRIVFKVKLGAASYHPLMATGGLECLRMARDARPDLILLDLMLPDLSGVEVIRRLRADPVTCDIPVIVVSALTSLTDRLAALEAGADDVFSKPWDDQLLMARVRNLLRSRQDAADLAGGRDAMLYGMAEPVSDFGHPGVLALVTDRTDSALQMRRDLGPLLRDRIVIMGHADALLDVEPGRPSADIYIIETDGKPGERGLRLLSDLRSRLATRHAGICILSSRTALAEAGAEATMAFDLGADAVIDSRMTSVEMALRLRMILRRKQRADRTREQLQDGLRLAMLDPLTGLFNRRFAMPKLTELAGRAVAAGRSFAVMIADLDRFKSVNDRYGHATGDAVLIEVARRFGQNLRGSDLLARVGGEEFLIAVPDAGLEEAQAIAVRLCQQIEARAIEAPGGEQITVTVSIGLAIGCAGTVDTDAAGLASSVTEEADQALLLSKTAGRNTVTIARSAA